MSFLKRIAVILSFVLFVSFPANAAEVKQIPKFPDVNTGYYKYQVILYNKYFNSYFIFFSTVPYYFSMGDLYRQGERLHFIWSPDTSDDWVLHSQDSYTSYLYNLSSKYSLYLSSNYDILTSSGAVKYSQVGDVAFTEHAKANFGAYADYWNGSGEDDGNAGFISGLRDVVNAVLSLPSKIVNGVVSGIKSLFVPPDGFIEGKVNYLSERFKVAFGITPYDMSGMFSAEKAMSDIKITIYGVSGTIVKMDYVKQALAIFRKIIRGFIALLLLFYNINQFLGIIGQAPMTFGAIIGLSEHKDEKKG